MVMGLADVNLMNTGTPPMNTRVNASSNESRKFSSFKIFARYIPAQIY